jgi:hypothetical protein
MAVQGSSTASQEALNIDIRLGWTHDSTHDKNGSRGTSSQHPSKINTTSLAAGHMKNKAWEQQASTDDCVMPACMPDDVPAFVACRMPC